MRKLEFANFIRDKNVIIVGNSVELMNHEKAEFIDSHDVVIRLGSGGVIPFSMKPAVGKKFDVWCVGLLRANLLQVEPKKFQNIKHIMYNRNRIWLNDIYSPYAGEGFWELAHSMFDYEELYEICERFGVLPNNKSSFRLSNGFLAIYYMVEKAKMYKTLTIIGFDFFKKSTPKRRGNSKADHYSWHRPVQTAPGKVHDAACEENYVLEKEKEGKLIWHRLGNQQVEDDIIDTKYGDF